MEHNCFTVLFWFLSHTTMSINHKHTYVLFVLNLPSTSHRIPPPRLSQSTRSELPSHTANSYWISILHMECISFINFWSRFSSCLWWKAWSTFPRSTNPYHIIFKNKLYFIILKVLAYNCQVKYDIFIKFFLSKNKLFFSASLTQTMIDNQINWLSRRSVCIFLKESILWHLNSRDLLHPKALQSSWLDLCFSYWVFFFFFFY